MRWHRSEIDLANYQAVLSVPAHVCRSRLRVRLLYIDCDATLRHSANRSERVKWSGILLSGVNHEVTLSFSDFTVWKLNCGGGLVGSYKVLL